MKTKILFALFVTLLAGCQSPTYTGFAPFDARLEPTPKGGAVYCLLVNRSGQTLHNYSCSTYVWSENGPWGRESRIVFRGLANGPQAEPGFCIRFRPRGMAIEAPIQFAASKIEVVGQCDEGSFRQAWVRASDGELKPLVNDRR